MTPNPTNNIVHLRAPVVIRRTADPMGAIDVGNDLQAGAVDGTYMSIIALVQHKDGGFEVIQSGIPDTLKTLGALQFAAFDTYIEAKSEAEPMER